MENKIYKFIKKHYRIISIINCILVFLLLVIILIYLNSDEIFKMSNEEKIALIIFIPCSFIMIFQLVIKRITHNPNNEVDNYYKMIRGSVRLGSNKYFTPDDLEKVNNDEINSTSDIIELMFLNMKEIKEYYVLSKTMAKRSFILAVIMCIFGFIIISTSIITIFATNISFTQSIVPVIGGTVVEAIAGTSLVVYKKSLEQLNQYYESLHNNERFLSLVNIVDKLSDDKKDDTYINIINSQLEVLKTSK